MSDIKTQLPVKITDGSNTVSVIGTALKVDGSSVTQTVTGTVTTVPVGTQTVTGSISVTAPATQTVAGTVTTVPSGTQTVTSGEISSGIIVLAQSATDITEGSVGTMTYTVTSGKTFYLKSVLASSSGGPCKVTVDRGTSTIIPLAIGFYSSAVPFLEVPFAQPIGIASGTEGVINVKIKNNVGSTMDVYSTIIGHEI